VNVWMSVNPRKRLLGIKNEGRIEVSKHCKQIVIAVAVTQFLLLEVTSYCFAAVLPLSDIRQEQTNWCWTASSEAVLDYYGVSTHQCDMTNDVFGETTCCVDGSSANCNRGDVLFDIPLLLRGAGNVLSNFGKIDSTYIPWALSKGDLELEIKAKKPWIMGWRWLNCGQSNCGGHTLVGYGLSGDMVNYLDPLPGTGGMKTGLYSAVKQGSDHKWDSTRKLKTKAITFLIDDTESMVEEIADAKAAALKVLADNKSAGKHFLYTLMTFKDGEPLVLGQSLNPDDISPLISALSAVGGAGCPESSLLAVRRAVELVEDSELVLMTDADSNGYGVDDTYATLGEIKETTYTLLSKKTRLHSIIYSDCNYSSSATFAGASLPERQHCSDAARSTAFSSEALSAISSGKSGFEYISRATGGLYFNIPAPDTAAATDTIIRYATADDTIALYDGVLSGGDAPEPYAIPVDNTVSQLQITLSTQTGSANTLELTDAGGSVVNAATPGVSVVDLGGNIQYSIGAPALMTGNWTARVGGTGTYRLSSVGATANSMTYSGDTSKGVGGALNLRVEFKEDVGSLGFELVSQDGSSVEPVELYDDGSHSDGRAADLFYAGTKVMNSIGTYRLRVSGAGFFQRMYEDLITVGSVDVVTPPGKNVPAGISVSYTFEVRNLGTTDDMYDLFVRSSRDWADIVNIHPEIAVAAGGVVPVIVNVTVPSDAVTGDVDILFFKAISQTNPIIYDTEELQTIVNGSTEGTLGTELTLLGTSFGDKKGKVLIGGVVTKIVNWSGSSITCALKKGLPPGTYDVTIKPQPYKKVPAIPSGAFIMKNPELDLLSNTHGTPGAEITIKGKFFSTKKGKVFLQYDKDGQLKKKNCKVTFWSMDKTNGESMLKFVVPKGLPPGTYPLWVTNKVGQVSDIFTIDPLP